MGVTSQSSNQPPGLGTQYEEKNNQVSAVYGVKLMKMAKEKQSPKGSFGMDSRMILAIGGPLREDSEMRKPLLADQDNDDINENLQFPQTGKMASSKMVSSTSKGMEQAYKTSTATKGKWVLAGQAQVEGISQPKMNSLVDKQNQRLENPGLASHEMNEVKNEELNKTLPSQNASMNKTVNDRFFKQAKRVGFEENSLISVETADFAMTNEPSQVNHTSYNQMRTTRFTVDTHATKNLKREVYKNYDGKDLHDLEHNQVQIEAESDQLISMSLRTPNGDLSEAPSAMRNGLASRQGFGEIEFGNGEPFFIHSDKKAVDQPNDRMNQNPAGAAPVYFYEGEIQEEREEDQAPPNNRRRLAERYVAEEPSQEEEAREVVSILQRMQQQLNQEEQNIEVPGEEERQGRYREHQPEENKGQEHEPEQQQKHQPEDHKPEEYKGQELKPEEDRKQEQDENEQPSAGQLIHLPDASGDRQQQLLVELRGLLQRQSPHKQQLMIEDYLAINEHEKDEDIYSDDNNQLSGMNVGFLLKDKKIAYINQFITMLFSSIKQSTPINEFLNSGMAPNEHYTSVTIFNFLLENSDANLRLFLLFVCAKFMPIPLITKVAIDDNTLAYKAWPEVIHMFEKQQALLFIDVLNGSGRSPVESTELINNLFGCSFSVGDDEQVINHGSIEVQLDNNLSRPQHRCVAYRHGTTSAEQLEEILKVPFFDIVVIRIVKETKDDEDGILRGVFAGIPLTVKTRICFIEDPKRTKNLEGIEEDNTLILRTPRINQLNDSEKFYKEVHQHLARFVFAPCPEMDYTLKPRARLESKKQLGVFLKHLTGDPEIDVFLEQHCKLVKRLETVTFAIQLNPSKLISKLLPLYHCKQKILALQNEINEGAGDENTVELFKRIEGLKSQLKISKSKWNPFMKAAHKLIENQETVQASMFLTPYIGSVIAKEKNRLNQELQDLQDKRSRITEQQNINLSEEQIEEQMEKIRGEVEQSFSMEYIYREFNMWSQQKCDDGNPVQINEDPFGNYIQQNLLHGQPFELIDGDNLVHANIEENIKNIFKNVPNASTTPIVVISIYGPQSSGKSLMLRSLFGAQFISSEGRCTKGIYTCMLKYKMKGNGGYKYVLLLDSEGIQSMEARDSFFDIRLLQFLLLVSHVVLICNSSEMTKNMQDILYMSLYNWQRIEIGVKIIPKVYVILNKLTDVSKEAENAGILKQVFSHFTKKDKKDQEAGDVPLRFIQPIKVSQMPMAFDKADFDDNEAPKPKNYCGQFKKSVMKLKQDIIHEVHNAEPSPQNQWWKMEKLKWIEMQENKGIFQYATKEHKSQDDKVVLQINDLIKRMKGEIDSIRQGFQNWNYDFTGRVLQNLDSLIDSKNNTQDSFADDNLKDRMDKLLDDSINHGPGKKLLTSLQSSENPKIGERLIEKRKNSIILMKEVSYRQLVLALGEIYFSKAQQSAQGLADVQSKAIESLQNNPTEIVWEDDKCEQLFEDAFSNLKQEVQVRMKKAPDRSWAFIRVELFRNCIEAEKDRNPKEEEIKRRMQIEACMKESSFRSNLQHYVKKLIMSSETLCDYTEQAIPLKSYVMINSQPSHASSHQKYEVEEFLNTRLNYGRVFQFLDKSIIKVSLGQNYELYKRQQLQIPELEAVLRQLVNCQADFEDAKKRRALFGFLDSSMISSFSKEFKEVVMGSPKSRGLNREFQAFGLQATYQMKYCLLMYSAARLWQLYKVISDFDCFAVQQQIDGLKSRERQRFINTLKSQMAEDKDNKFAEEMARRLKERIEAETTAVVTKDFEKTLYQSNYREQAENKMKVAEEEALKRLSTIERRMDKEILDQDKPAFAYLAKLLRERRNLFSNYDEEKLKRIEEARQSFEAELKKKRDEAAEMVTKFFNRMFIGGLNQDEDKARALKQNKNAYRVARHEGIEPLSLKEAQRALLQYFKAKIDHSQLDQADKIILRDPNSQATKTINFKEDPLPEFDTKDLKDVSKLFTSELKDSDGIHYMHVFLSKLKELLEVEGKQQIQVPAQLEKDLEKKFDLSFGCNVSCPLCNKKCEMGRGHEQQHCLKQTGHYLIPVIRQGKRVLTLCNEVERKDKMVNMHFMKEVRQLKGQVQQWDFSSDESKLLDLNRVYESLDAEFRPPTHFIIFMKIEENSDMAELRNRYKQLLEPILQSSSPFPDAKVSSVLGTPTTSLVMQDKVDLGLDHVEATLGDSAQPIGQLDPQAETISSSEFALTQMITLIPDANGQRDVKTKPEGLVLKINKLQDQKEK